MASNEVVLVAPSSTDTSLITIRASYVVAKPRGMVIFDAKCTGDTKHDIVYVASFCHFAVKSPGSYAREDFHTHKFVLNLQRQEGESWRDVWVRCCFSGSHSGETLSMRAWESHLDELQTHESAQTILSSKGLAIAVHEFLSTLETHVYSELTFASSSDNLDRHALSHLLGEHDFPLLCYDRATDRHYRRIVNVDEIVDTLYKLDVEGLSKRDFCERRLDPLRPVRHDVNGEVFELATLYVATQMRITMDKTYMSSTFQPTSFRGFPKQSRHVPLYMGLPADRENDY